jgi:hypothetical protein
MVEERDKNQQSEGGKKNGERFSEQNRIVICREWTQRRNPQSCRCGFSSQGGRREAVGDCRDAEARNQTEDCLSDENRSVARSEERVNGGQKCRVSGDAHIGGGQLAADEQAVDTVVEPVAGERIVEFGVTREEWKVDHEKEAQREPGKESGGGVCPSNRQAKYTGGETFRNYATFVSTSGDGQRGIRIRC